MKLKSVHVPRGYDGLHCEVDGCIVNIHTGLTDIEGRTVTRVSIMCDDYAGEPSWSIEGRPGDLNQGIRIIQEGGSDAGH